VAKRENNAKIEVIFCDDTKMPRKINVPPISEKEKQMQESFFKQLDKEFGFAI